MTASLHLHSYRTHEGLGFRAQGLQLFSVTAPHNFNGKHALSRPLRLRAVRSVFGAPGVHIKVISVGFAEVEVHRWWKATCRLKAAPQDPPFGKAARVTACFICNGNLQRKFEVQACRRLRFHSWKDMMESSKSSSACQIAKHDCAHPRSLNQSPDLCMERWHITPHHCRDARHQRLSHLMLQKRMSEGTRKSNEPVLRHHHWL